MHQILIVHKEEHCISTYVHINRKLIVSCSKWIAIVLIIPILSSSVTAKTIYIRKVTNFTCQETFTHTPQVCYYVNFTEELALAFKQVEHQPILYFMPTPPLFIFFADL